MGLDDSVCEHCNITLTGKEQYIQHLGGKKHLNRMSALGLQPPTKGPTSQPINADQTSDEDQIGSSADHKSDGSLLGASTEGPSDNGQFGSSTKGRSDGGNDSFLCKQCNITLTGKEQYEQHLGGRKHKIKMSSLGKKQFSALDNGQFASATITSDGIQFGSSIQGTSDGGLDNFLCKQCNITLTGKEQYEQHLGGKKHKMKMSALGLKQSDNGQFGSAAGGGQFSSSTLGSTTQNPSGSSQFGSSTKGRSDSDSFLCKHCNIPTTGKEQYIQHLGGKKHKMRMTALGMNPDSVSDNGQFGSSTQSTANDGHFASSTNHSSYASQWNQSAASGQLGLPLVSESSSSSDSSDYAQGLKANIDPVMNAVKANFLGKLPTKRIAYEGCCTVCNVQYTSASHKEQHLYGQKHAKKLKLSEGLVKNSSLACSFCNISVNSVAQMDQHREGTSHKRKVESAQMSGGGPPAKMKFVRSSEQSFLSLPPPPPPPLLP